MEFERFKINRNDDSSIVCDYFKRNMGEYNAHIFTCKFDSLAELESCWERIVSYIAVYYQSKVKIEIEKANFYIGFFADFPVSIELKNRIEQDSFCAKKYIFDNFKYDNDPLDAMEIHIFSLKLQQMPSNHDNTKISKISKICLQNFRGYAGKATFDLKDEMGAPASFVLIYAHNGIGKTSFTDGIEFALKGEVERLVRLEKQTKKKGPVYHHYDRVNQKAYVQLFVTNENGEEIEFAPRMVPKFEDGTDTKIDHRSYKKYIKSSSKQWDMVILPHDKVDSFITANSPEQRYNEWTKTDPFIQHDADKLKASIKDLKDKKKAVDVADDELKNKSEELNKLKEQREGLERIVEMVHEYNELDSNTKLPVFEKDLGLNQYYMLITEVKSVKEEEEKKKEEIRQKISQLNEWISCGFIQNDQFMVEYKKRETEKEDLEKNLKLIDERTHIVSQINHLKEKMELISSQLKPYNELDEYGIEKVFIELENEHLNRKQADTYEKTINELNKEIKNYEDEIENLGNKNPGSVEKLNLKETAIAKINKVELKKERKNILSRLDTEIRRRVSDCVLCYQYEIQVDLLQKLCENKLLDKNDVATIFNNNEKILEDLKNAESVVNGILAEHKMQSENLDKLQKQAIKYLNEDKKVCNCPVCNTTFQSWEALIASINRVDANAQQAYLQRLDEANRKKASVEKERDELVRSELAALNQAKDKISFIVKELDDDIKIERGWFASKKIISEETELTKKNVVLYFDSLENSIEEEDEKEIKRNKLHNSYERAKKTKIQFEIEKEKLDEEYEKFRSDPIMISLVELAKDIENDYRNGLYDNLKKDFVNYQAAVQKEELNLKEWDSLHNDIQFLQKESICKLNQECDKWLEEKKSFVQAYTPYYKNPEKLMEKKLECEKAFQEEEDRISRLSRIINEESVSDYISKFERTKSEYNILKDKRNTKKREYDECEKNNEQLVSILKENIKNYFSGENANIIYHKIDPNNDLTDLKFTLSFEDDKPQLNYEMTRKKDSNGYTAEMYLSTAQLNAVAFSSFFARALSENQLEIQSIIVDDPIGSFDDMNILGFADLIRSIIMNTESQIIMTTHDSKIFSIMKRKLDSKYHSSCFIELPKDLVIEDVDDAET